MIVLSNFGIFGGIPYLVHYLVFNRVRKIKIFQLYLDVFSNLWLDRHYNLSLFDQVIVKIEIN